jgi:hypothetical protein
MTVEEAVSRVLEMSERSALVAKAPFTWGSEAMIVELTPDYGVPQPVIDAGFDYLLEREDLVGLLKYLRKKKVSSKTKAEFIIHYALTDCTPAWIDDIPDR